MCTAAGLRVRHLELCTYSYTRNVARAWLAFACLAKRHLGIQQLFSTTQNTLEHC